MHFHSSLPLMAAMASRWRDGRQQSGGNQSPREEQEWWHRSPNEEDFLANECGKLLEMGNRIMVGPTVLSTFLTMQERGRLERALGLLWIGGILQSKEGLNHRGLLLTSDNRLGEDGRQHALWAGF
jgi:hypothetical protein